MAQPHAEQAHLHQLLPEALANLVAHATREPALEQQTGSLVHGRGGGCGIGLLGLLVVLVVAVLVDGLLVVSACHLGAHLLDLLLVVLVVLVLFLGAHVVLGVGVAHELLRHE